MPSEIIIPGFIVMLIIMVAAIAVVGVILHASSILNTALNEYMANTARRISVIEIINASAIAYTETIEFNVTILNKGSEPLYDMASTDVMVQYFTISNSVNTLYLKYGVNWEPVAVYLTSNYSLPYTSKPVVETGECLLIKGWFSTQDIDVSKPLKIIIVSQYGAKDMRWVTIGS